MLRSEQVNSWLSEAFWHNAVLFFALFFCCVEKKGEREHCKEKNHLSVRVNENERENINNALCNGPGEFGPPSIGRCHQGDHARRTETGNQGNLSNTKIRGTNCSIGLILKAMVQACLLRLMLDVCVCVEKVKRVKNVQHGLRLVLLS